MSLPPGPAFLPFPLWGPGAMLFFEAGQQVLRRRYGGIFTLRTPLAPVVVISEPDLIKQVFAGGPDELHFGEQSPLGRIIGMRSLFGLDEDAHIERRKLLLPPFHGERMHAYEAIAEEEARGEFASWPEDEPLRLAGAVHADHAERDHPGGFRRRER